MLVSSDDRDCAYDDYADGDENEDETYDDNDDIVKGLR